MRSFLPRCLVAALALAAGLWNAEPARASDKETEIAACIAAKASLVERIAVCGEALKARHLFGQRLRQVHVVRGMAYLQSEDFEGAINDFDAALRLNRRDQSVYLARGQALLGRGSFDHAFADFSQVIRQSPKSYSAYFERGLTRIWRREFEEAVKDYTVVINAQPKQIQARGNRGWARLLNGQFKEAAADFAAESQAGGRPLAPMWRYLAVARGGSEGRAELEAAARAIDATAWPGPIVQTFQGTLSSDGLVQAARHADPKIEQAQLCEAYFYDAQRRLLIGDRQGAMDAFQNAKAACPVQALELVAAWAEFDSVSGLPAR